jgi:hypothetical protein
MDWLFSLLDFTGSMDWVTDIFRTDIAKMTIAFTIAAHLHRRWVKKDVSEQFAKIVDAIDGVSATVSKDLAITSSRIGNVEDAVKNFDSRLGKVESILVVPKPIT